MDFKENILKELKKHVRLEEMPLEVPPDSSLGDFAFPCFPLAKEWKKNPVEIARELKEKIKLPSGIREIQAKGPYLNFFTDKEALTRQTLVTILRQKETYGAVKGKKQRILIEYVGPNTNKPLHLGHVRNMVIGKALIRLLGAQGNEVIAVNINNDRGIHISKSMLAYQKWGKADTPAKSKLKPDFFVGKYYVLFSSKGKENPDLEKEAQDMLKKWEEGDTTTIALWKKMNSWAYAGFKETYATFGVKFKKEYFESQTYKKGRDMVLDGLQKGIFAKDEKGAVIADLEKEGLGKKVLLRSDGTSVYVTQDLALAKARYDDFRFDKMVHVVASEQIFHFKVLFTLLRMLKMPFADRCQHFPYGMVNLTTGRMKSREGKVVDADNLFARMVELAKKAIYERHESIAVPELERRATEIALGAIQFYLLRNDSLKDILFDPESSISFEGDTGPYVQYAHARICSVLRRYGKKINLKADLSLLGEKEEVALTKALEDFPAIARESAESFKLHVLAHYLISLSKLFNEFYHTHQILKEEEKFRDARLLLITAVKQVIANGLGLLGISAPERM